LEAPTKTEEILIAGLTPSLSGKSVSWFYQNKSKIINLSHKNPFWKKHILFIKQSQKIIFRDFLSALTEIGYEKIASSHAIRPGTFQVKGGIIDIFPINSLRPFRVEFFGNFIETLFRLPQKITEKERRLNLKRNSEEQERLLNSFKPGEYAVHEDHGIGIFKNTAETFLPDNQKQKMLVIEYAAPRAGAEPDRLYVPRYQIKKLNHYIGFVTPTVHRLGSPIWNSQKKKARQDIVKFAKELFGLYKARAYAFRQLPTEDQQLEKEFESSFEHAETPDQHQTWQDIKADFKKTVPMDRLIVGDVGFGKTEIALRAAFKIAFQGGQVALIAPTTILADQHYQVFSKRFNKFGLNVAILSRFESTQNQKETIRKLKIGLIDVIIGTHRVLSRDVIFKNLRLLILDEEQRFGVRQKEKLKNIKKDIDILSLSATPIPRTLYLALGNLRSLSVIETPPPGRINIKTHIGPWDQNLVKEALRRELQRGGQIFWLHNKVEVLAKLKEKLEKLYPKLKIATAHGRMGEASLRKTMNDFREGRYDILVTTTIIENGLDLPNVNTLIVDKAEKLGLGQAYQLRGRIGRSTAQGFAYFFHGKNLGPKAKARLEALEAATKKLGQGFLLAKKDLEIRGAGNVLGREQSGAINKVGFNLYCQMLNETVEQIKNSQNEYKQPLN